MTEETLFIAALEIRDAAGRTRFLDSVCAGDAALRGRLDRLLGRHARAGDFLARPAVEGLDAETLAGPGGVPTETAPAGRSPAGTRPAGTARQVNS